MRLLLSVVLLCGASFAQSDTAALRILQRVSDKYRNIDNFEWKGTATWPLASGLTARVAVWRIYVSRRLLPEDAPFPHLDVSAHWAPEVRDSDGKAVGKLDSDPDCCYEFRDAADRAAEVKLLRSEEVIAGGAPRMCDAVSVRYEDEVRSPAGRPVVYWIERSSGTVWKVEFSQKTDRYVAQWSAVVDKWSEGGPLPEPAQKALKMTATEDAALIGRAAPEISGQTLDGTPFSLSKLRGKVVVLDFWAVHCGYCSEEMAELEQLRTGLSGQGVEIIGIAQDKPEPARRWLADRKRTLPSVLVEPDTAFKAYNVEGLPTTVVIDAEGKIVKHWGGFSRGSKVKRAIDSLLAH